ncbi:MAG: glyoxalase/bleomycin resistance/extradiol dioxygenase family protein [Chitinophagia bacterium]|jgi:predicted lactoylglutathione lyase|nr:glyoxalase/bleomycin resistance/extradiol dioxygenase family protein [Chitinophagia bacterium]
MKQVFINLPVKDVNKSMEFYKALGFVVNPLFTFDDQKCLCWSDSIYLMLQNHEMFISGINKNFPDPKQNVTATFTLPVDSLEILNNIIENGIKAGGTVPNAMVDEGFMLLRNIEDLDGHNWGIIHLDIEKFKQMRGK